jgi:hypothetical protein
MQVTMAPDPEAVQSRLIEKPSRLSCTTVLVKRQKVERLTQTPYNSVELS